MCGRARLKITTSLKRSPIASSQIRLGSSKSGSRGNKDLARRRAETRPVRRGTCTTAVKLEPQLATLANSLPTSGDWITETKLDGYRLLARIDKARVKLFTRNGNDWTTKFPALAAALRQLPLASAWLDGEIVVLKDDVPSFSALQNAIDGRNNEEIVLFLFDLMYLDGKDLRKVPLWARRARLAALLEEAGDRLRFSQDFDAPPAQVFEAAAGLGLEGLVLKRRDAPYESGRTESWLKAKARLRQELVICGMTARGGKPGDVGSLLLGYYVGNKLHDAGSVGTGWDSRTAQDLWKRLAALDGQGARRCRG